MNKDSNMDKDKEEKLKKLIEDKKNKNSQSKSEKGKEFSKLGNKQKAFKNKKSGGFFDK